MNEKTISVSSIVTDENQPLILVQYGETEATITVVDARKRAIALIRGCCISQTEASILKVLAPPSKGFSQASEKELKMFKGSLALIRSARPRLDVDINPIFGFKTRLPLVNYKILTEEITLEIDTALHHAQLLLECAEAAEGDAFMYKMGRKMDLSREEVSAILLEFAEFRKINMLENLFEK